MPEVAEGLLGGVSPEGLLGKNNKTIKERYFNRITISESPL